MNNLMFNSVIFWLGVFVFPALAMPQLVVMAAIDLIDLRAHNPAVKQTVIGQAAFFINRMIASVIHLPVVVFNKIKGA